jgi:hypothetical protein
MSENSPKLTSRGLTFSRIKSRTILIQRHSFQPDLPVCTENLIHLDSTVSENRIMLAGDEGLASTSVGRISEP